MPKNQLLSAFSAAFLSDLGGKELLIAENAERFGRVRREKRLRALASETKKTFLALPTCGFHLQSNRFHGNLGGIAAGLMRI